MFWFLSLSLSFFFPPSSGVGERTLILLPFLSSLSILSSKQQRQRQQKQGPGLPTLAFGGSGPLFIFYAGVAEGLIQSGLLVPGVSRLAGFSGGALTSVLMAAGVPPRQLLEVYKQSSIFCNGTLPDKWWQRPPFEAKAALRSYAEECMKTAHWPLDSVAVSWGEERDREEGEK